MRWHHAFFRGLLILAWTFVAGVQADDPEDVATSDADLQSTLQAQGWQFREATSAEIQTAVGDKGYRPMLRDEVVDVLQDQPARRSASRHNEIVKAFYQATLNDEDTLSGDIQLQFSRASDSHRRIGPTNLRDLQLLVEQKKLTLGQTADRSLYVLGVPPGRNVQGYWVANGQRQAGDLVFDLQLPQAVISEFQLQTPIDVVVTSPNSLISPPSIMTEGTRQFANWKLFPAADGRLTLQCSSQRVSADSLDRNLNVIADYEVDRKHVRTDWNLTFPPLAAGEVFTLQLSHPANIQSVATAAQTPVFFRFNPQTQELTVRNNTATSLTSLTLSAEDQRSEEQQCHLPILNGGRWQSQSGEASGRVRLSAGTMRVIFSQELALRESDLRGLMETDVEFSAEGRKGLTLRQDSEDAAARFLLMDPKPVLQEKVVTVVGEDPDLLQVFMEVECRSGTAEQLTYRVPGQFRVTSVRDIETQHPILFRRLPMSAQDTWQDVDIVLPSPLAAGSQQMLELELQATGDLERPIAPELQHAGHLRLQDFVVISPGVLPGPVVVSSLDVDFEREYPWVPPTVENSIILDRSQVASLKLKSRAISEVSLAVDHSLAVEGQTIREVIRLSLSAAPELPAELTFETPGSAQLRLQREDEVSGMSLERTSQNPDSTEWTITLPGTAGTEVSMTLECERPATRLNRPMLVWFPSAKIQSASLTRDGHLEHWNLLDGNDRSIAESMAYPVRPLESDLQIVVQSDQSQRRQLEGQAIWLMNSKNSADVLLQLAAFGFSDRVQLKLSGVQQAGAQCLVDGKPMSVVFTEAGFDVLLPRKNTGVELQVLLPDVSVLQENSGLQIPMLQAADTTSNLISSVVIPPTGYRLETLKSSSATPIKEVRINNDFGTKFSSTEIPHFHARVNVRQNRVVSLFVPSKTGTLPVRLTESNRRVVAVALSAAFLFVVLVLFVPGGPISWIITGALLLLFQCGRLFLPDLLTSMTTMTAVVAFAGAINYSKASRSEKAGVVPSSEPMSAGSSVTVGVFMLVLSLTSTAVGQESRILSRDPDSPLVYVPPTFGVDSLSNTSKTDRQPLFLKTQVQLQLLSRNSLSATFDCQIATDSAIDHRLELPDRDVTLVNCQLDGTDVLPVRRGTGAPAILIPATPQPPPLLAPRTDIVAKSAPGWIGGFRIHRIQYTVRLLIRPNAGRSEATLPLPVSPETKIDLHDTTDSLLQASLLTPESLVSVRLGNQFNFPAFGETGTARLQLEFAGDSLEDLQEQQTADVVARITVTPSSRRLSCAYEVRPTDLRSEGVRLQRPQGMNLLSAQLDDGTEVPATLEKDSVVISLSPDRQGTQQFRVEWLEVTSLSTVAEIDIEAIGRINGIRATNLSLIPVAGSRYLVGSVRAGEGELEPLQSTELPRGVVLATDERVYEVADDVESVQVELVRLLESREARVRQAVVVDRRQLLWSCECELQIPGEPVFRQQLTVSEDLRIRNVTARGNDSDRLQSWYRDGDQLVVSFREATRDSLQIRIEGIVPRAAVSDTALPVLTLPDSVEVFEFSLQLSAVEPESVYIRSLEGTTPNEIYDIANMPLPTTPLRLTVTDETQPLILRADPVREVSATVVGLLTSENGQNRLALYYALEPTESQFELQLTRPSDVAYATAKMFSLTADGSVTQTQGQTIDVEVTPGDIADNDLSIVAITGIVPALASNLSTLPLPKLDVPLQIESLEILDGRDQNGVAAVPEWVRDILPDIEGALPGNTDPLSVALNEEQNEIRIRLPAAPSQDIGSIGDNLPAYALTVHALNTDDATVQGSTGILVFSSGTNSVLPVSVSPGLTITQILVDGQISPMLFGGEKLTVRLNERATFVQLRWTAAAPALGSLTSDSIRVPELQEINGNRLLVVNESPQPWTPLNATEENLTPADLLNDLTIGLQLIGSANIEEQPGSLQESVTRLATLTNSPVWSELEAQSLPSAASFLKMLNEVTTSQPQPAFVRVQSTGPIAQVKRSIPLSAILILCAAVAMIIAGIFHRRPERSVESVAESIPDESGAGDM